MDTQNEIKTTAQTDEHGMTTIHQNNAVTVKAALGLDNAAKTQKLLVVMEYPDGDFSPIKEFFLHKLGDYRGFKELLDFVGIDGKEEIKAIFNSYKMLRAGGAIGTVEMGGEKCSITEAHAALTEYVTQYMEPGKVFVKDGYGHIESSYLSYVLKKLGLGYERLELLRNFKRLGLLRLNGTGAAHPFSYKVGRKWFVCFKLADLPEGGEQA